MRRKILIVLSLLVALGVVVFLLISKKGELPIPAPTPTLSITTSSPVNGQEYVADTSMVSFSFNRKLNEEEKTAVRVVSEPLFEFSKTWEEDKKLTLTPSVSLKTSTSYKVEIFLNDKKIYEVSFSTNIYSTQELLKQGEQQTEDDLLFGKAYGDFYNKNPWYKHLPIDTADYTITYDFERNSFRIRIKKEGTTEEERNLLVNKALGDLQKIGVDTQTSPYYVL